MLSDLFLRCPDDTAPFSLCQEMGGQQFGHPPVHLCSSHHYSPLTKSDTAPVKQNVHGIYI